jgi:serine/threonine-protein kinase
VKLGDLFYYGNRSYDNYPVVWVDRGMAKQYCEWRGARLPSQAEWEKAARGTDQRVYPWGNEIDINLRANGTGSNDGFQVTAPVGSFPLGISPYGAFDMAGNVSELVEDNMTVFFEGASMFFPMTKGGDWYYRGLATYDVSFLYRQDSGYSQVGFRCARDSTP